MTDQEAWGVIALLRAGSVAQQLEDDRLRLWHAHVLPLPLDRTMAAARRWIVAPSDKPKFLSALDDVLTALNVPGEARDELMLAAVEGSEVHPGVRGWVRVERGAPLPEDVLHLRWLLGRPDPPALPAGPPIGAEQRAELAGRLKGLASGLTGGSAVEW